MRYKYANCLGNKLLYMEIVRKYNSCLKNPMSDQSLSSCYKQTRNSSIYFQHTYTVRVY
jgi:hypothetical protein